MVEACAQDSLDHWLHHSRIAVGPGPLQNGEVEVETLETVAYFLV